MRRGAAEIGALAVLLVALGIAAQSGLALWRAARDEARIARLAQGADLPARSGESERVRAARGMALLARNHPADAQDIADRLAQDGDPPVRAALIYDIGNAMMRRALPIYYTKPMRQVAPLIQVAKSEYRQALEIDPEDWDARFNLDVAAALVRETESPLPKAGTTMSQEKATIPDAPGVPNGMP